MNLYIDIKYRVIVILGGGLIKENGKWRTTNFNEGDNFGAIGDRLRIEAASYLYNKNPKILIIVLGGKGQFESIFGAPCVSKVIEKELIELGVSKKNIINEVNSGNTWQQLQELRKIIIDKKLNKIIIISNKYHLPRVRAMIEHDFKLQKAIIKSNTILQSAEEILLKYNPKKWKKLIKIAYESNDMQRRILLEKKGVMDIKQGKYKLR